MKVLLTGATGFIGSHLTRKLEAGGHEVLPVSRSKAGAYGWSADSLAQGVGEADAVINLAGESLFGKRWSDAYKKTLVDSRVETTRRLSALVAERKPAAFISASAIGYYGPNDVDTLAEGAPPGSDFLSHLCQEWERAAEPASRAGVPTAIVRIGVVLGMGGGALANMLPPFRFGLGGPLGSGRQWVSWIHMDDLTSLFLFLLENPSRTGVFNATAPAPVTMKDFAKALGHALRRPAVLPVPAFALRAVLGQVADILLTGQRVVPERAREAGFRFRHEDIQGAFVDLVG